ncbi:MAG TPA: hypothetical protein DCX14_05785 [Flavobacteriales bacterium]|nr:hypothetical protein [Flavobacteriales bacterium]
MYVYPNLIKSKPMRSLKLILLTILITGFYGCEKCTTCTTDIFDGECTCLGIPTSHPDISYTEEKALEEACTQSASCTWSSTVASTDSREECGKTVDVEAESIKLEAIGWECTSVE